jgi:hypothetical protein
MLGQSPGGGEAKRRGNFHLLHSSQFFALFSASGMILVCVFNGLEVFWGYKENGIYVSF